MDNNGLLEMSLAVNSGAAGAVMALEAAQCYQYTGSQYPTGGTRFQTSFGDMMSNSGQEASGIHKRWYCEACCRSMRHGSEASNVGPTDH